MAELTDEEVIASSAQQDMHVHPHKSYLELGALFWINWGHGDEREEMRGAYYNPKTDRVSMTIYPFLIQMERLRLQGTAPDSDAMHAIEEAMFAELQETFGPLPEEFRSRVCAVEISAPPYLNTINNRIFPYRAMMFAKEIRSSV